jgi:hypothetical protein
VLVQRVELDDHRDRQREGERVRPGAVHRDQRPIAAERKLLIAA